jgi:hypothetical protein
VARLRGWLVGCLVLLSACSSEAGSPEHNDDADDGVSESASAGAEPDVEQLPADLLLPNMRSVAATGLRVAREEGERRLRFTGSLANLGAGPLVVRPRGRGGCPPRQIAARQLIHRDTGADGTFQRRRDPVGLRRDAGCMLDHPGHDHWHFDAMAAYSLQRPDGTAVVERDKVSFCLRDNERARRAASPVRSYYGECTRRSDQGISPGWVDVYTADLDGQYLRLPGDTPRGTLCLVLTADPYDQLVETDETDNATTIPIRIRGARVRRTGTGCAVRP